jgi:phosphoribosylformylglycinamidine cyclo-ligase
MNEKITYKDAGVDVNLAENAIHSLSRRIKSTYRAGVIDRFGGFGSLFRPDWRSYEDPVLVSSTDGVGTKLRVAFMADKHDTVGIDLVAMSVNDIVVMGAAPLFFLDYFATGVLNPLTLEAVIAGIVQGCKIADCALIGGETAEMPDSYPPGEYDLAGFCVGIAERASILEGDLVKPGDAVIGLASSGLHSNGYSLVRKVLLEKRRFNLDDHISDLGKTLAEELLTPTAIYVVPLLELFGYVFPSACAHITGGGFQGNIPRVLPEDCGVIIRKDSWSPQPIFDLIQREAELDDEEMFRTFNMGVGMIVLMPSGDADPAIDFLRGEGLDARIIGEVVPRDDRKPRVSLL